jgi:hypothetical protein
LYRSDKLARQGWLTGHYRNIWREIRS